MDLEKLKKTLNEPVFMSPPPPAYKPDGKSGWAGVLEVLGALSFVAALVILTRLLNAETPAERFAVITMAVSTVLSGALLCALGGVCRNSAYAAHAARLLLEAREKEAAPPAREKTAPVRLPPLERRAASVRGYYALADGAVEGPFPLGEIYARHGEGVQVMREGGPGERWTTAGEAMLEG